MLVQLQVGRPAVAHRTMPSVATDPGLAVALGRERPAVERAVICPASPGDMAEVAALIDGFARRGLMLPKTPEQLWRTFREFLVARDGEGRLLGCGALRVFTPALAEVSALAVAPAAHGRGVGRRLVESLVAEARALGVATLFALTLQEAFFHRLGFRTVSRALFPEKVAADCAGCDRRSRCREITVALEIHGETNERGAIHG